MMALGFLSRLFGKGKAASATPGLRVRPGTDRVSAPLRCPACSRQVAKYTPEKGIFVCECGGRFAILNYEAKPLPKDVDIDDAMR